MNDGAVAAGGFSWQGLHHVGFIVEDLERSRGFYQGVLGAWFKPQLHPPSTIASSAVSVLPLRPCRPG